MSILMSEADIWLEMVEWGSWIFEEKKLETPSMYWGIIIFTNFEVRVCQKVQFLKVWKKWSKSPWSKLTLNFVHEAPIRKLRYKRFTCKQHLGLKNPGKNTVSSWSLSKNGFSNISSYHYDSEILDLSRSWPKVFTHEIFF